MLLRLLIAGGVIAFVVWVLRRAFAAKPSIASGNAQKQPVGLSNVELRKIEAIARKSKTVEEALHLRPKILEVTNESSIAIAVDNLVREIAHEAENELRIADALLEIDDSRLGEQLSATDDQMRAAQDEEGKKLAEGTIERLMAVRDGRDKLRRRGDEIATRSKHLVLELRSAHLAMLEAVSSAGASAERVEEIRARLKQACDDAQRSAVAEEEVAKLIARSGTVREG
jgi:hypothetical protein